MTSYNATEGMRILLVGSSIRIAQYDVCKLAVFVWDLPALDTCSIGDYA